MSTKKNSRKSSKQATTTNPSFALATNTVGNIMLQRALALAQLVLHVGEGTINWEKILPIVRELGGERNAIGGKLPYAFIDSSSGKFYDSLPFASSAQGMLEAYFGKMRCSKIGTRFANGVRIPKGMKDASKQLLAKYPIVK